MSRESLERSEKGGTYFNESLCVRKTACTTNNDDISGVWRSEETIPQLGESVNSSRNDLWTNTDTDVKPVGKAHLVTGDLI